MGMADIVTMKENDTVALKDVLDDLDIKHDDAVEFLKRVGFPVWREVNRYLASSIISLLKNCQGIRIISSLIMNVIIVTSSLTILVPNMNAASVGTFFVQTV